MLDNRLKDLNNVPEDTALKQRIYKELQGRKKHRFPLKESVIFGLMICIAFFLFVLPQVQTSQTAATGDIEMYTAFGGEPGKFFARPSTLYTGVQQVENAQLLSYFEHLDEHVTLTDEELGYHIADIIVVEHGKQTRYQMSDTTLLNVDTGEMYVGDEKYVDVFHIAYDPIINSWQILLPIIIMLANLYSVFVYKRAKITFKFPLKYSAPMAAMLMVIFGGAFYYARSINPIFEPLICLVILLYGLATWWVIKKSATSHLVYKTEKRKIIVLIILLLVFFTIL